MSYHVVQFIVDDPESAGPGQYESCGSVGKQSDSKKLSFPAVGFTQASRERDRKVIQCSMSFLAQLLHEYNRRMIDPFSHWVVILEG